MSRKNNKRSLRKDAQMFGGFGRGRNNKVNRASKHKDDRLIDKRRRRRNKKEIKDSLPTYDGESWLWLRQMLNEEKDSM